MSRAFRDTFKQTFCFICQNFLRRESTVSSTQLPITKKRQYHTNTSVVYEHIPTLQTVNHSTTIPLLNENQLNGLRKNNSCST